MKALFLAFAFLITGCATTYINPNKPTSQFDKDLIDCEVKAGQTGYVGRPRNDFEDRCLRSHGWIPEKEYKKQQEKNDKFLNSWKEALDPWVGTDFKELESQRGKPAKIIELAENKKAYSYYQDVGTVENGSYWCQVTFVVAPSNKIEKWALEGNSCNTVK